MKGGGGWGWGGGGEETFEVLRIKVYVFFNFKCARRSSLTHLKSPAVTAARRGQCWPSPKQQGRSYFKPTLMAQTRSHLLMVDLSALVTGKPPRWPSGGAAS